MTCETLVIKYYIKQQLLWKQGENSLEIKNIPTSVFFERFMILNASLLITILK